MSATQWSTASSRRALVKRFLPSSLDVTQGSSAKERSRLNVDLVHHCGSTITGVLANMLSGKLVRSDYDTAAESFTLLGRHFAYTRLDRHFDLLLPASNTQETVDLPESFSELLRSYNGSAVPEKLPSLRLPTGESYTRTVHDLRTKGLSGAFYAHADAFALLGRMLSPSPSAAAFAPVVYTGHTFLQTVAFCGITKKDACQALSALAKATDALTAPFLILCTLGGLAAVIALVVETDGLAAPEAAELYAEAEDVCAALESKSIAGVAGAAAWLQTMLSC